MGSNIRYCGGEGKGERFENRVEKTLTTCEDLMVDDDAEFEEDEGTAYGVLVKPKASPMMARYPCYG